MANESDTDDREIFLLNFYADGKKGNTDNPDAEMKQIFVVFDNTDDTITEINTDWRRKADAKYKDASEYADLYDKYKEDLRANRYDCFIEQDSYLWETLSDKVIPLEEDPPSYQATYNNWLTGPADNYWDSDAKSRRRDGAMMWADLPKFKNTVGLRGREWTHRKYMMYQTLLDHNRNPKSCIEIASWGIINNNNNGCNDYGVRPGCYSADSKELKRTMHGLMDDYADALTIMYGEPVVKILKEEPQWDELDKLQKRIEAGEPRLDAEELNDRQERKKIYPFTENYVTTLRKFDDDIVKKKSDPWYIQNGDGSTEVLAEAVWIDKGTDPAGWNCVQSTFDLCHSGPVCFTNHLAHVAVADSSLGFTMYNSQIRERLGKAIEASYGYTLSGYCSMQTRHLNERKAWYPEYFPEVRKIKNNKKKSGKDGK